MKIAAIDFSMTSTGLARQEVGQPVEVRRFQTKPPSAASVTLATRSTRLRKIAHEVTQFCVGADLVVIEGPTYASDSGAAHDRAGGWWLIVARLTGAGMNVVEVSPTALKTYATGKGNSSKDQVLASVVRRYPDIDVSGNDIADATVLLAMGLRFIGLPLETTDLPQTHLRGMKSVKWLPTR